MKPGNMRVLILSENFPKPSAPELGTFVQEQARELSKLCQVSVIAPLVFPLNPKRRYNNPRIEALKISKASNIVFHNT